MGHSKEKDKNKERERTREKEGTKSKKKEEKESKKKEKKEKSYEFLKYPPNNQDQFRSILLDYLHSDLFDYPIYASELFDMIMKQFPSIKPNVKQSLDISSLLQEFGERKALTLQQYCVGKKMQDFITDINKEKIIQLSKEYYKDHPEYQLKNQLRQTDTTENTTKENNNTVHTIKLSAINLEQQLKTKVGSEREALEESAKQYKIMNKLSQAEEQALAQFRKQQNKIDYCDFGTREKCQQARGIGVKCLKAHFEKIIRSHTDESLGNCSYLDTCRHMDQCKFVHYKLDIQSEVNSSPNNSIINNNIPSLSAIKTAASSNNSNSNKIEESKTIENLLQPQWICCDLRKLDFRVLGKFDVIMADPPWDIHMQLPYETMKDKEMKSLRVDLLQDEGLIFLWVTGRAMELGRECLQIWGYKQVEEIIWIKTNQLQRIIRTGRTGHWLNHSKEHCLVGIKGNPKINTMIDCDVIVSEVRETSRKPDEIYQVIERIHPGGRKIELFGRPHNCSTGWLTLGNQIPGVYILEEELLKNYSATYPDVETSKEKMEENRRQLLSTADQIYNSHIQQTPNYNNNNNTNNNNNNNNNNINNNKSNYKPPNQSPMNNNNHTAQIANIGAGQVVTGTLNSNNIENNDMINTSTGKINNQKISQIITKQITNTANNQINNQINSPINISNALNNNNNEPQVNNNYQIVNNNSNGKPFVSSGNRNFDPLNSQKKQFIDQSFPVQRLEPYFNQAPPTLPMNNQFFPNAFLNRQNFNNPRFQNQFFNNNLGYRTFNRFKYKNHQSQPFLPNNIDSINQNQNTNNQSFNINNNANNNNNNTTQKDQQQQ